MYVCNLCGFKVPVDQIGAALMTEHLREESHTQGRRND